MINVENKVVLITGASSGIGEATARLLAKQGAKVVLGARRTDKLEAITSDIRRAGGAADFQRLDVADAQSVRDFVAFAKERFGRIDVLFNNAGICGYGLAHELTEPAWDAMIDINLKGAWIVARHVIPHMIEARRGVIVNNSSIAGLRGMGRLSHYAASKWGLTGLTKSWAIELAPHDIRVVSIHPTGVDTPLNDGLAMLEGLTTQEIAERSAGNLQPVPWIEAQDVADAVVFLVSDKARYMTGTELVIDAGLLTK
jgi:NAD(P)-dependent dehydrogenase (short-subunit alcohol dehydrogenase family)